MSRSRSRSASPIQSESRPQGATARPANQRRTNRVTGRPAPLALPPLAVWFFALPLPAHEPANRPDYKSEHETEYELEHESEHEPTHETADEWRPACEPADKLAEDSVAARSGREQRLGQEHGGAACCIMVESSIQSARAAASAAALWRTRGERQIATYKNSATCFSVTLFLLSVFT